MDPATKQDIKQLKEDIAEMMVAQTESLRDEIAASERRVGAMIEQVQSDISGVADLVQRDDEKVEDHEKRIGRLEDHAGLPTFESAIEG